MRSQVLCSKYTPFLNLMNQQFREVPRRDRLFTSWEENKLDARFAILAG